MAATDQPGAPGVFLPWDSEFFGFRVGRLHANRLTAESLSAALAWAAAERLRCAYFFAEADDAGTLAAAHAGGFKFVDLRVDLATALPPPVALRPASCRAATAADLPRLEALARTAHRDTRFFKDTLFPAERAAELYPEWIRRDFRVHRILVATREDGSPAGYVTCQTTADSSLGRIGLIAVAEDARRHGFGSALVTSALQVLRESGCTATRVATQGSNLPALRLYQEFGFRPTEVCATYHRWF